MKGRKILALKAFSAYDRTNIYGCVQPPRVQILTSPHEGSNPVIYVPEYAVLTPKISNFRTINRAKSDRISEQNRHFNY